MRVVYSIPAAGVSRPFIPIMFPEMASRTLALQQNSRDQYSHNQIISNLSNGGTLGEQTPYNQVMGKNGTSSGIANLFYKKKESDK